ncbi:MAG: hypothetical protein GWN00_35580 [Aliifodinibius sp.]|nr:hypothetical protein [candidate division Zixibacteria bacterium]NIR67411.1 hypothetical protein [candidate division Zixibacteria bacterium]NIT61340.1 hypothetical protein [Fodinibius sp.]NIY29920.1 hypothetical protein [Fodinibius sp.]
MALTVTKNDVSEFTVLVGTITFDASYPAGGEAIAASDFGLTYLKDLIMSNGEGGYVFAYDKSEGKIKAFEAGADAGALDEVSSADLSGEVVGYVAVGIGEVDSDDF